MRIQAQNR